MVRGPFRSSILLTLQINGVTAGITPIGSATTGSFSATYTDILSSSDFSTSSELSSKYSALTSATSSLHGTSSSTTTSATSVSSTAINGAGKSRLVVSYVVEVTIAAVVGAVGIEMGAVF